MESDVITLQDLFKFKIEQITADRIVIGSLRATGLRPTFLDKFEKRRRRLPVGLFRDQFPLHFSANGAELTRALRVTIGAPARPGRRLVVGIRRERCRRAGATADRDAGDLSGPLVYPRPAEPACAPRVGGEGDRERGARPPLPPLACGDGQGERVGGRARDRRVATAWQGKPIADAIAAARAFALHRNPHQPLAIVTFDNSVHVRLPFTTDPAEIEAALRTIPSSGRAHGSTTGSTRAWR